MKKKDLLKLIKSKSEEVNIKDFSQAIVEQAKLLPQKEVIIAPKKRFSLKLSLIYSLSLATAVFAFFIIYEPSTPVLPEIQDVNQVFALSAVSAVSLATSTDDIIIANDNISLSLGYFALDTTIDLANIDDEMDDVSRYFEMMEKLLNSDEDFDYQLDSTIANGYKYHLTFVTKDLLDQQVSYTFNFNKIENQAENQFTMNGNIEIGDNIYTVHASGDLINPQNLQLRLEKDASNYIHMTYQLTEEKNQYRIQVTENNVIRQAVNLEVKNIDNQRRVYLNFVEGQSTGSYAFKIEETTQGRMMFGSYYIAGSDSESGEMEITINPDGMNSNYDITVRPQGRMPYIVERQRGMSENGGRPHGGNSMTSL